MLNPNYDNVRRGFSSLECKDKRLIGLEEEAKLLQSQLDYEASRRQFYDPLIARRIAQDAPLTSFPITRAEQKLKPPLSERFGVKLKNLVGTMGGVAFAETLIQVLSLQESAQAHQNIHSIPMYPVMLGMGAVAGALFSDSRQGS